MLRDPIRLKDVFLSAGVARGCGWQHLVVYINLGGFYCIGMLVAAFLAFKTTLRAKVRTLSCYV